VIFDEAAYDPWLDPATPAAEAKALLTRNRDDELQVRRAGRAVNSVKKQGAEWVEPVNPLRGSASDVVPASENTTSPGHGLCS
jgi:putative SOS response-associated peptidase YedK